MLALVNVGCQLEGRKVEGHQPVSVGSTYSILAFQRRKGCAARVGSFRLLTRAVACSLGMDERARRCWLGLGRLRHGDAPGCTATEWASCLWNKGLATNVAAFAVVGAAGVAKLGTLLPPKLQKMFSPRTVERVQMLSSRLRHGQSEDLTGKSFSEVVTAKRTGKASSEEVSSHMIEKYTAAEGDAQLQANILEEMKMLEKIPCGYSQISNSEGTLLFIIAKLSHAAYTSRE